MEAGFLLFVSNISVAIATAIRDAINTTIKWYSATVNYLMTLFQSMLANPIMAAIVLVMIFISIIWFPWHHVFLAATQSVYTCLYRPLASQAFLPMAEAIAPLAEKVIGWWNFFWNVQAVYISDLRFIPLRCKGTPEFIDVALRSITPIANALVLLVQTVVDTLMGIPVDHAKSLIVAGLLGDSMTNITAAGSGLVSCYCSVLAYPVDAMVLVLADSHFQCTIANTISFVLEIVAQILRTIYHWFIYTIDVIVWIINKIITLAQEEEYAKFPKVDAWYLMPDLTNLVDYLEAFGCCTGDLFDDILNSLAYIAGKSSCVASHNASYNDSWVDPDGCDVNVVEDPWRCNCSIPVGQIHPFKLGGIIKSFIPPIVETIYIPYKFLQNWITYGIQFAWKNLDEQRLFDTYEAMCIDATTAIWSIGDGLNGVVLAISRKNETWFQPGTVFNAIFSASAYYNHTCRASVSFDRAIVKLLRDLPNYTEYQNGRYFDCWLHAVSDIGNSMAFLINDFAASIPDIYSCHVEYVPAENRTKLVCDEKMFGNAVGDMIAAVHRTLAALANYVITVSERATTFTQAKEVPTDDVFDEIIHGLDAYNVFMHAIIKFSIPLSNVHFTLPKTDIEISGDDFVAQHYMIDSLTGWSKLIVEIPRFIMRSFHHGNFVDWEFQRADIEHLARSEYDAIMAWVTLETRSRCVLYNNNPNHTCYWEINLGGPEGSGICPLNLMPCMKDPMAHLYNALARFYNSVPEAIFFPYEFSDTFFDKSACELENAAADLEIALGGLNNITVNFTRIWGTAGEINVGEGSAFMASGIVQIVKVTNELLVDTVRAYRELPSAVADENCKMMFPDMMNPFENQLDGTCHECWEYDTGEYTVGGYANGTAACQTHFGDEKLKCCPSSGRCSIYCRVPDMVIKDMTAAIQTFAFGAKRFADSFNVIDPMLGSGVLHLGYGLLHAYRTVIRGTVGTIARLLAGEIDDPYEEPLPEDIPEVCDVVKDNRMSSVLADTSCIVDELGDVLGAITAVPLSILGRSVGSIGRIVEIITSESQPGGPTNSTPTNSTEESPTNDFEYRTLVLSRVWMEFIGSLFEMIGEFLGFIFRIIGALMDGQLFMEDGGLMWCHLVRDGVCSFENATDNSREMIRHLFANLDISGDGYTCELGDFAEATYGIIAVPLKHIVRIVAMVGCPENQEYGAMVNLDEIFTALRRFCAATGNLISGVMYSTVRIFSVSIEGYPNFRKTVNALGTTVGTALNVVVSTIHSVVLTVLYVMTEVFGDMSDWFVGIPDDLYPCLRPFGESLEAFLRAFAVVMSSIWKGFGSICNFIADFVNLLFVDENSAVADFVSSFVRLITSGLSWVFSIFSFSSTNIKAATSEFIDAIFDFISAIFDDLVLFLFRLIDGLLFPNVLIGGEYGLLECFVEFKDCIIDIVFGKSEDIRMYWDPPSHLPRGDPDDPYDIYNIAERLRIFSFSFDQNDECFSILNSSAEMLYEVNMDECNYIGNTIQAKDPFICVPHLNMGSRTAKRMQVVWCIKRMIEAPPPSRNNRANPRPTFNRRRHSTKETPLVDGYAYKCIDSDGYWITNNTLCIIQILENATDVAYASIIAIARAITNDTEDAYATYRSYLQSANVDPLLAMYYDQMVHQYIEYGAFSFAEFRAKMLRYALNGDETKIARVSYFLAKSTDLLFNISVQILTDVNGEEEEEDSNFTDSSDDTEFSRNVPEKSSYAQRKLEKEYKTIVASETWHRRALQGSGFFGPTDQDDYSPTWMEKWGGTGDMSKWCGHDMTPWFTAFGPDALYDPVDDAAGFYNFTGDPDDYADYYDSLTEHCPEWCPNCTDAALKRSMLRYPCPANKCGNIPSYSTLNRLCGRICGTAASTTEFSLACHWDDTKTIAKWVANTNQYTGPYNTAGTKIGLYETFKSKYPRLIRKYSGITSQLVYLFMEPGFRSAAYNPYSYFEWTTKRWGGLAETGDTCQDIGTSGWPSDQWCDEKCNPNSHLIPGKQRSFIEELILSRNDAIQCIMSHNNAPCSANITMKNRWKYLFEKDPGLAEPNTTIYPHLSLAIFVTDPEEIAYARLRAVDSAVQFATDMCGTFCGIKDRYCERMQRIIQCQESPTAELACLTSCDLDWTNAPGEYVVPPKQCSNRAIMTCNSWDPYNPPESNSTCKCPAVISNTTGMCESYTCSYTFGSRGRVPGNSLPFFCPLTAKEAINTFWPFDYANASLSITQIDYPAGNLPMVPQKTVQTSDYIALVGTYNRASVPNVTGTECKVDPPVQLSAWFNTPYNLFKRYTSDFIAELGIINTVLMSNLEGRRPSWIIDELTLTPGTNRYCYTLDCKTGENGYIYLFPSAWCMKWNNDDRDQPRSYGTYTITRQSFDTITELRTSAPFSITTTFSITSSTNTCPPDVNEYFVNGICDTSDGNCDIGATWTNPQPNTTCDRDIYCYRNEDLIFTCTSISPNNLSVTATATNPGVNVLTRQDVATNLNRGLTAGYTVGPLNTPPSNFNATTPWVYSWAHSLVFKMKLEDGRTCSTVTTDYSLTGCSVYNLGACVNDTIPAEAWIFETQRTCGPVSYKADTSIIENAASGQITLGEFTSFFNSLNPDVGGVTTTFTGTGNVTHTITASGTNDFCENLCPLSDMWCINLLNGTGIDCNIYRSLVNPHGRLAARKIFCEFFPLDIQYVNASMFPISGTGTAVSTAGAKTIIQNMPVNAIMCPTNTGRWGTQVSVSESVPTMYPTYSTDGCVMRGPHIPMGAEPTEQDCQTISEYADYVQRVYTWIQNGAPTDWNQFTRDVKPPPPPPIIKHSRRRRSKTKIDAKEMLIEQVTETRAKNLKLHMLYAGIDTKTEYGSMIFTRVVESQWCEDSGAIHQRNCRICMLNESVQCNRYPDPEYRESEHLPLRVCNYTDLEYPCIRVMPLAVIPDNPMDAYVEIVTRSRAFNIENPFDDLVKHSLTFKKFIRQMANKISKQKKISTSLTVSEKAMLFSMARSIELAACSTVPGSAACARLDDAIERSPLTIKRSPTAFRFEKDVPAVPKNCASRTVQQMLVRADTLERRWDVVIPPLDQMRRDCYLVCGYDFRDLLERSCLWQAADSNGPIYGVVESLLDTRQVICNLIAPTNGSEYFIDGGGIIAFNGSLIKFRPSTVTSSTWGDQNGILYDLKKAVLNIAGWIIGIKPTTFTIGGFFSALGAKFFGNDDTSGFSNDTFAWATNLNVYRERGDVGLYYWATMFLPPPVATLGMTCDKLNGTNKLFGIIPFWNPFWTLRIPPLLPVWAPNATVDLLRLSVKYDFIVPERMVKDPSGCRRNISTISVPFTEMCDCNPEFYNCAEVLGMSGAFDSFFFALNWLVPNIAQSRLGRFFAEIALMSDKNDLFANISNSPDFNDYLYCFVVTTPGIFWVVSVSPFSWTSLTALAELLFSWIYVCLIVLFAFILFIWNRERDINLTDAIDEAQKLRRQRADVDNAIDVSKKIINNPRMMEQIELEQFPATGGQYPISSMRHRSGVSFQQPKNV